MRLIRLVAFFGSLMLLTATVVLFIERRIDVQDDQSGRVRGAADAALVSIDAALDDVIGALDRSIDVLPPDPDGGDLRRSAAALGDVADGAQVCMASSSAADCTGDELLGLSVTGNLLGTDDAADGMVVVAVDSDTDRVVVVRRALTIGAPDGADPITAVLAVPGASLFSEAAAQAASDLEAVVELVLVDRPESSGRFGPERVDGEVVLTDRIDQPFEIGSLEVITTVDGDIGFFSESTSIFVLLIGLGSVLLVLAGGTFLADRRNLEERAATDDLTGLANRREFERVAAEAVELADRFGTGLTVMVADLNGFKQINDTLGHQFGDLVLKGTSDRLVQAVRETDLVGRWGGDEFVILLPGLDEASAIRGSCERITAQLSSSPVVGDTVMRASIGAAAFPRHGANLDALLRTADAAMYAAKTTGVPFRVADAELFRRANGIDEHVHPDDDLVVSPTYVGPDRRSGEPAELAPPLAAPSAPSATTDPADPADLAVPADPADPAVRDVADADDPADTVSPADATRR